MSRDSKAIRNKEGRLLSFLPSGEYYFSKGVKAYRKGEYLKAKKYLQRAHELEPFEPIIACQLALVCTELNEFKESNRLLFLILEELDPYMIECHYFLANNFAYLGYFRDAHHHASLYLELDHDGEFANDARELMEMLFLESDDMEEDELIIKNEEAQTYLESGNFEKAIVLLEEVIEGFPKFWSAYNNLALAYFYVGEKNKANKILDEVLEKNPGNLHSLCNKMIFSYYNEDEETVYVMREALVKIKPILTDHQYKLAITFALIGDYEHAYFWLKKLYKNGYHGDNLFYYWLAYSAYYCGNMKVAEKAWDLLTKVDEEKKGKEPWLLTNNLHERKVEERLFHLFLHGKEELNQSKQWTTIHPVESQYMDILKKETGGGTVRLLHEAANHLASFYKPEDHRDLFVTLFSFYRMSENYQFKNEKALAAAAEYMWRKRNNETVSQKECAEKHGCSISTLQKYIKIINSFSN